MERYYNHKNHSPFIDHPHKIYKMAPQAKKIRVRCKNVAFYTTESLYEPFFAEQKRKNGAAGKKNWVQPWTVPDFFVDIFFLTPEKVVGPPKEGKKSEFPNFQIN